MLLTLDGVIRLFLSLILGNLAVFVMFEFNCFRLLARRGLTVLLSRLRLS